MIVNGCVRNFQMYLYLVIIICNNYKLPYKHIIKDISSSFNLDY